MKYCYYVTYRLFSDEILGPRVFRAQNISASSPDEVTEKIKDKIGDDLEYINEITKQGTWNDFIKDLNETYQGD